MRRPSSLLALALLLACGGRGPGGTPAGGSSSARPQALPALPSRAEVVALSDQWALEASKKPGRDGAALYERAARLRQRIWRLERREADALEAVELFRSAARDAELACSASVERALIEGELRGDAVATYRAVYAARVSTPDAGCRARADAALLALDAFKPLPSVLFEIEREQRGAKGGVAAVASVRPPSSSEGPVVVPSVTTQAHDPARITSIERYGGDDAARVSVFVTRPTTFEVGVVEEQNGQPPRLFVDIHHTTYSGKKALDVGGLVQRVRVGAQKDATRVVLDLSRSVYRKVFYLPEPFRLVIDVSKEPPPAAEKEGPGPRSIKRVVLDPGHGGHDPGATGPGGLREKDVTLDIAHRAAPLIARELGVSTLLTRDGDAYIALDERTARANAFNADVLISIHCNASEDGSGNGFMTFVLDESADAHAARIAARENAASAAAAAELANALSRVLDQGTVQRSVHFAELLQRATGASLNKRYGDVPDHGVKRAGFYVLAGARMPAVLFESSFISNPMGELRLNTADYRQKMADAIVNAVRAYRDGH
ncbi:MAG TPA: N-acetylmuramoyl-L-alanine amidase [Polyangiaceae bacterium]|nr:N-acetylmuramoyl-L-alanine amidase [Polyangiaceae bacterium]